MSDRTHYEELGIPKDADAELIKAVYRALVKVYHPDLFRGDKSYAAQKLARINLAYEVLSDKSKRAAYDEHLRGTDGSEATEEMPDGFEQEFDAFTRAFNSDWTIATEFFPEAELYKKELGSIDLGIAFVYQSFLLSTKRFAEAPKIAEELKRNFLAKKFGSDTDVHSLVIFALKAGNRRFANELNKALVVLGSDQMSRILERLASKYADFAEEYYPKARLGKILRAANSLGLKPGLYRATDGREFSIEPDFRAYKIVRGGFFSSNSIEFDSVAALARTGDFTETELKTAQRIGGDDLASGLWAR